MGTLGLTGVLDLVDSFLSFGSLGSLGTLGLVYLGLEDSLGLAEVLLGLYSSSFSISYCFEESSTC